MFSSRIYFMTCCAATLIISATSSDNSGLEDHADHALPTRRRLWMGALDNSVTAVGGNLDGDGMAGTIAGWVGCGIGVVILIFCVFAVIYCRPKPGDADYRA